MNHITTKINLFTEEKKEEGMPATHPLNVCLIGCGPSGMMLLHALASRKANLDPSSEEYASLPIITCYEKASNPGGVWRTNNDGGAEDSNGEGGMYDALWSNGPKESYELFDKTFDDYFGKPTPAYLPRADILEYLLERNNTHGALFTDNVKYQHSVLSVTYNTDRFSVKVSDDTCDEIVTSEFDRCIWAAGVNGKASYPKPILNALDDFEGKTMHSSQIDNLLEAVNGKRVCLIGDSSSAEDLALQIVKLGGEKVFITSRRGLGDATCLDGSLEGKIKVVYGVPVDVQDEANLVFQEVYYDEEEDNFLPDEKEELQTIQNIDTIIYCTGYKPNIDFLDPQLIPEEKYFQVPKDWKMKENGYSKAFGEVKPSEYLEPNLFNPSLHNNIILKSNPKMMYLEEYSSSPIFELDVQAWMAMRYLCDEVNLPSVAKMNKLTEDLLELEMQSPDNRILTDIEYGCKYTATVEDIFLPFDPVYDAAGRASFEVEVKILGRLMKEANYPLQFGSNGELNELGMKMVDIMYEGYSQAKMWNFKHGGDNLHTFRDYDASKFSSIITGTSAVPFKEKWMDIDSMAHISDL